MGLKDRLNQLENEINADRDKIKLQNGEEIYLNDQDLLTAHAEAIEFAAKNQDPERDADWNELSEITRKIAEEAEAGQEIVQRARILLGKEEDPDKAGR
jgi:hypothetical protein